VDEALCVVPVEKMTVKLSQFLESRKSQFQTLEKFQLSDIAENRARGGGEEE